MYLIFQTIILLLLFLIVSGLVLYIPGFLIIAKDRKKLTYQEIITLSLALGVVIFVLGAVILSFLNLRFLVLPILITINVLTLLKYKLNVLLPWKIFTRNRIFLFLIVLGILIQGLINFPSGYIYEDGLNFWSSQGHDGIWHISLMEEVKKAIPLQNPVFAGEGLYNYHYLVDILMGEFFRVFPIFSSLDLYFRFFPVFFSLMIGVSVFALVTRWQQNEQVGYLAMFFTYFVGSFGYIITFIRNGQIFAGETVFWAAQQNTLLGNPPHAISHVLLVAFFLAFLIYLKNREKRWLIISFILAATLAGFKVSGGFVMLIGISAASVIDLFVYRRRAVVILAVLLGLSNFITFKAMTSKEAASFLMFLPWWFIRTMVVDKLGWMDMEFKRQHYISKGTWHAWLRVLQLETTAFAVFVVGNLGMRVIGLYAIIRNIVAGKDYKKPFEVMLMVTMITGLVVPIFFVQKGIIYNNIQFMQYFMFIFGFYGAITVHRILSSINSKWLKVGIFVIVAVFSLPTVIGNLNEFYGPNRTALARISKQDLQALQYLKDHTDPNAIILNAPFNKFLKDRFSYQPKPIYAWYSTAYIPALTGRRTYLSDEEQVLITGYPVDLRLSRMKAFFEQKDFSFNKKFLKENNISYIYLAKNEIEKPIDLVNNDLGIAFENSEVVIYKVAVL